METVYIYGLFDPRTDELRYIGKSKHPDKRLHEHILDAKRNKNKNIHKDNWIGQLLNSGLEPCLRILERCTQDNWQDIERKWIAKYKKPGNKLINLQGGGENPPTWDEMFSPEEAKKKIAESNRRRRPPNKGRRWDEEYRKKMSKALSGKNNPMYGKFGIDHPATGRIVTSETRERLSEALKGERNPMYGKTHTEETRKKLSIAGKGRKQTDEDRLKKSLSCKMHFAKKKGRHKVIMALQQEYFNNFGEYHPKYLEYA